MVLTRRAALLAALVAIISIDVRARQDAEEARSPSVSEAHRSPASSSWPPTTSRCPGCN
jgi:hypothetical protein